MLSNEVLSRVHLIEDDDLRDHVINGIRVLRDYIGDEWPDRVNTDTLDLSLPCECVVGQVYEVCDYRQYQQALVNMKIYTNNEAAACGFEVESPNSLEEAFSYDPKITYADLTDAWRLVLS